jgi:hypothetical protein
LVLTVSWIGTFITDVSFVMMRLSGFEGNDTLRSSVWAATTQDLQWHVLWRWSESDWILTSSFGRKCFCIRRFDRSWIDRSWRKRGS